MDTWASVSGARRFLKVAVPLALTIDMIHNMVIISRLAQSRWQELKDEEYAVVLQQVHSMMQRVAVRCQADCAFWPATLTRTCTHGHMATGLTVNENHYASERAMMNRQRPQIAAAAGNRQDITAPQSASTHCPSSSIPATEDPWSPLSPASAPMPLHETLIRKAHLFWDFCRARVAVLATPNSPEGRQTPPASICQPFPADLAPTAITPIASHTPLQNRPASVTEPLLCAPLDMLLCDTSSPDAVTSPGERPGGALSPSLQHLGATPADTVLAPLAVDMHPGVEESSATSTRVPSAPPHMEAGQAGRETHKIRHPPADRPQWVAVRPLEGSSGDGGQVPARRSTRGSFALDFAAGITALVPQWMPQAAAKGVSRADGILGEWVAAAHKHVPVPLLQMRRRSALRWHVRCHGMAWPMRQTSSLERDLSQL